MRGAWHVESSRRRLRPRWATRPTHASGPSVVSSTAPSALAAANTPKPANAVCESVSFTPPRMSAGMASTGIARTIANTSTLIAVSAVTVAAG